MQDTEILGLWKAYDQKLEETLLINRRNAIEITNIKTKSLLSSMTPLKIFTIAIGIVWVCFVDLIIVSSFSYASPFFTLSAVIQVLLTKIAILIYVYQLVVIQRVNINEPVLQTQEKLSSLKSSTLWVARLLFLQCPVWTTFYLSKSMIANSGGIFFIIQILITVAFGYISVWLFLNIKYENRHKKWFKLIFNSKEWDPIIKAMDLLEQVKEYKATVLL